MSRFFGRTRLSLGACVLWAVAQTVIFTNDANAEQVTWRLNSSQNPTHPVGQAYQKLAAEIAQATKDTTQQIELVIYPAGQLYTIDKQFSALATGQIQMSEVVPSFVTGDLPSVSVNDLPFLWPSVDVLWTALKGEYGKLWVNEIQKAGTVHVFGFVDNGYIDIFHRSVALVTPDQVNGMKLRLSGKYYSHWIKELGAQPVSIPGSETLPALQNGTIDGVLTTDTLYVDRKQYEAAPFATALNITPYFYALAANKASWDGLAPDTQAALTATVQKFEDEVRTTMAQATTDYRKKMSEVGTLTTVTPAQHALWEATADATWKQYLADNGENGKALLDAALAARK